MDWNELRVIAGKLRGVTTDAKTMRVGEQPFVRLVDEDTASFALAEPEDRDALIARVPSVYFITERFVDLPIVLAHLAELDEREARTRLHESWKLSEPPAPEPKPGDKKPAKPTGPRLFFVAYIKDIHKDEEKRKFLELGHGTAGRWLLTQWRAWLAHKSWGGKVPLQQLNDVEHQFQQAVDEHVKLPADDTKALALLCERLACTPHHYSNGNDDDEGVEWEFEIFDEEFFKDAASDYLSHPSRGNNKKNRDDGYRALLTLYDKHTGR